MGRERKEMGSGMREGQAGETGAGSEEVRRVTGVCWWLSATFAIKAHPEDPKLQRVPFCGAESLG